MQYFEKIITVAKDDLDELHHVNNVRYVQWIQEISKEHWLSCAPKHMQEEAIWVVLNHNIAYKHSAVLEDNIKIHTRIIESKGATSIRLVEMYNAKTNQLLIRSKTDWCLLSAKTLKPIRISDEIKSIFN